MYTTFFLLVEAWHELTQTSLSFTVQETQMVLYDACWTYPVEAECWQPRGRVFKGMSIERIFKS